MRLFLFEANPCYAARARNQSGACVFERNFLDQFVERTFFLRVRS
jgi:hypothetical protein